MLEVRNEKNYAAQVVRIPKAVPIPKADRIVTIHVAGYPIVVSKDWIEREGDLAVFFPAETQLSEPFASHANLFRHAEKNADITQSGYLEDNRRVRAVKLRGQVSAALMLPVSEVAAWSGVDAELFEVGTVFDHVAGAEICRKYRIKEPVTQSRVAGKVKRAFKRADNEMFPMHLDTDQYLRNADQIPDDEVLIVTQKLHGSSARFGRVPVRRQLSWMEKALIWLKVAEVE